MIKINGGSTPHILQKVWDHKTLQLYKCVVPSRSLSVYGTMLLAGWCWWCIVWLCFNSAFAWVCHVNVTTLHLSHIHDFGLPIVTRCLQLLFCYALFHLSSSSFLFPSGNLLLNGNSNMCLRRRRAYCIMLSHCCHVFLCQVYSVVVSYIPMNAAQHIKLWDDDYKRCAFRICEWHNIPIGDNCSE